MDSRDPALISFLGGGGRTDGRTVEEKRAEEQEKGEGERADTFTKII